MGSFFVVWLSSMANVPDAHEIIPGIWLGNRNAALNSKWHKQKGINVVFNASKDIPFSPQIKTQYRIPVDDNLQPEEIRNMTLWCHEIVYKVLKESNTGKPILIHCMAGMQRSAAITAMLLIAKRGYTAEQAITYIQGIRPIAFRPGVNFRESILSFERSYQEEILPKLLKME